MTDDILTTNGIASTVYGDGESIGHVLLVDYDGDGGHLENESQRLPGVTIVLESSPESYHLWNLTIRTQTQAALSMLELHGDEKQCAVGYRRGKWILRTTAKDYSERGIYKSRPEVKAVYYNETDRPQSLGHWNYARAMWELPDIPEDITFEGDAYEIEKYLTLTDHGKEKVRDGG